MTWPPFRRSDEIAACARSELGQTGGAWCSASTGPNCAAPCARLRHCSASEVLHRAARDMPAEDVFDRCAGALAIDRDDETSFDTHEFPKSRPPRPTRSRRLLYLLLPGALTRVPPPSQTRRLQPGDGCAVADPTGRVPW
jgi:hypothetical protein